MSQEANILVCFALKEEAGAFQKRLGGRSGVAILITGIGKQNARRAVSTRLSEPGDRTGKVLTCGFAGGLDARLTIGNVIFETGSSGLESRLVSAGAKPATFFCADRIVTTAAEKSELRRTTGANAVEMESAAVHAECRERGISCATLRVISDPANEDLPLDFNRLSNPDMSLNYSKLAWAIAKSPAKIPALLGLHKNCKLAAANLADVLAKVIWPR